jgi:hypothetical protein
MERARSWIAEERVRGRKLYEGKKLLEIGSNVGTTKLKGSRVVELCESDKVANQKYKGEGRATNAGRRHT